MKKNNELVNQIKERLKEGDEMSRKVREAMGDDAADNPFIASKSFFQLVTLFAMISRIVLKASTNRGEAVNVVSSLIVTFLKNVPDNLWDLMRKAADEQEEGNPIHAMFGHMDALRNYEGKNYVEYERDLSEDDVPEYTTKPPTHTC